MKYKVLLIGRNKVIMEDFFHYLDEDFEMQTSSMRVKDIMSHITYFKPHAIIFCMNKEEKARIDTVISLREGMEKYRTMLVLTGNSEECDAFHKASGGMGDLILKKPITVRSIKDKVVKFLDDNKVAEPEPEVIQEPAPEQKKESTPGAMPQTKSQAVAKAVPQAATHKEAISQSQAVPDAPTERTQEASPTKKHVLVVDDDPMMLKLIKEQLKDTYTVATAINGAIALKFLESKKTDLIIMDYEMPHENGAQVLEKIRNNPAIANLPVVFLTGVKDREKIRKLVVLKPQGYLLKPIESEALIKSIRSIIG